MTPVPRFPGLRTLGGKLLKPLSPAPSGEAEQAEGGDDEGAWLGQDRDRRAAARR